MSQPTDSDFSQASGLSGTAYRTAHNDYNAGILTKLSGTTAPATTFQYMWWIDTSATPPELNMRNAADSAWIKIAEIDTSDVKFFSELAAVVGLANTASFTENQTIDKASAAGSFTIKSDRTTGIAASVDLGGHDDGANDTIYVSLDAEVTDDTNGSEDGQLVIRVIQAGSEVARMTIGSTVSVTGTMNATTVQQGGTNLASIIEVEKATFTEDGHTAAAVAVPADVTRGERNRFTGASSSTWTLNSGTAGEVYPVMNDGTADITFAAGGGVTIATAGLTLGQQKVCTVEYVTATRVFIYGENT